MFLIIFVFMVTSAHNGTRNHEVCKAESFKSGPCWEAKQMDKVGKFLKKL